MSIPNFIDCKCTREYEAKRERITGKRYLIAGMQPLHISHVGETRLPLFRALTPQQGMKITLDLPDHQLRNLQERKTKHIERASEQEKKATEDITPRSS